MSMKKTLFGKVMLPAFLVLFALQAANAAEHKVASIADLLKIETLAADDVVTFDGNVVVEAAFQTIAILVDQEGTASIVTSIPGLTSKWLDPKLVPGDVIENYKAKVVIKDGLTQLSPLAPWGDGSSFKGYSFPHIVYSGDEPYVNKLLQKVTVKQLVDNQEQYLYTPLAIEKAEIKVADFGATLCYRNETDELVESEIKLQVNGMNTIDIPQEATISLSILKPGSVLTSKEFLRAGYVADLSLLKTIYKSNAETIEANLKGMPAVVVHVEKYKDITYYAIAPEHSHSTINSNSTRMSFVADAQPAEPFAVGDRIVISDPKAKYTSYYYDEKYMEYTPSSLVLSKEAVVEKQSSGDVNFVKIDLDGIFKFPAIYEYRPIAVDGKVTLRGTSSADKYKKFGITNAWLEFGDAKKSILVDTTLLEDKALRTFSMNATIYYPACLVDVGAGKQVLVPNSADDFITNELKFSTIEDLNNLEILDIQTVKLTGNVSVDAIYAAPKEDFVPFAMRIPGNSMSTRILVSDATGSLIVETSAAANALPFMVGDSITAIAGKFEKGDEYTAGYLSVGDISNAEVTYSTMMEPVYTEITEVGETLPVAKPLILKDVYIHLAEDNTTAFVNNAQTGGDSYIVLSEDRYPYGKKSDIKGFYDGETFYTVEIVKTEVSTVAEAKAMSSVKNLIFTGSLTFQTVPNTDFGALNTNDCVVFDETGFIRLRSYSWMSLAQKPAVGDKITFTGSEELSFTNTSDNAATIEIIYASQLNVVAKGQQLRELKTITLEDLLMDNSKAYNSDFVRLENINTYYTLDYLSTTGSPVKMGAVEGTDTVAIVVGNSFSIVPGLPSKLNMNAIIDYADGAPVLTILSMDDYTTPLEFNSIGGMKVYGKDQTNVSLKFNALVVDARGDENGSVYRVECEEFGAYHAVTVRSNEKQAKFAVGDSVAVDLKGASLQAFSFGVSFIEKPVNTMASLSVSGGTDASSKISGGNKVASSYVDMTFPDPNSTYKLYDNRYVAVNKGSYITNAEFTALGCVGYKIDENTTILVADTYYDEAGKPASGIVSGIIGEYLAADGSHVAAIMPRSAADFLKENYIFDNIAAMVKAGDAPSTSITYTLASPLVVTAVTTYTSGFGAQYDVVFVADKTDAMTLMFMKELGVSYKVNDVIKGVTGKFSDAQACNLELEMPWGYGYMFDIASLEGIEKVTAEIEITPEVVKIKDLFENVAYSGHLVTLQNVSYSNLILSQGSEVSESIKLINAGFEINGETIKSITGVYFLNGQDTKFIPRTQADIEMPTKASDVAVDASVIVDNGVIYADGAEISVYDITGRLLINGARNSANIAQYPQSVFVVRTVYGDGTSFITKVTR